MTDRPSIPKATGSMEGFYRSRSAPAPETPQTRPSSTGKALNAAPGAVPASTVAPTTSMEISTQSSHGKSVPDPRQTPRRSSSARKLEPRPSFHRQRSSMVLQSTFSQAAASAAAESLAIQPKLEQKDFQTTSMVCTVAYRGMEVIFATDPEPRVFGICARTQAVLQTLDLPSREAKVVSIMSDPATGMVAVAMSNGSLQTYHPVPTNSKLSSDPSVIVSAFGKFRWVTGQSIQCRDVFYGEGEQQKDVFRHERSTDQGDPVEISSSSDHKVLVAHRDQLAIFDATPIELLFDQSVTKEMEETTKAELLWTVRLERNIVTAKLSGDGRAVAVVVDGEGLANKNPFGVRTFLRDAEDGSSLRSAIFEPPGDSKNVKRGKLARATSSSNSVGILYKPGPFLVHPTNVSRMSFRGFGHETSNLYSDPMEGNDLLLTHCEVGSSMQIFSQNSWKQLIQWNTPPNTRADWIRGLSACNLGDLETHKRRKTSGSRAPSRRPSMSSDDSAAAINADLLGNRPLIYQGSNTAAGAWISEITFRKTFPAIRLSRLSYMKRAGDDMQPAHFESVAAILPSFSLVAESVLGMGDAGLSVQGIWPAWNPWWSESSVDEKDGTLSGSAMAFLGLSSVAPSSAGFFGEHNHGGTHGPPSELRLVASHPSSGKIVLMEFPLWGDNDFGAMELGSPLRYLLSLSEIDGLETKQDATEISGGDSSTATLDQNDHKVPPPVSLSFETDILCSQIEEGRKSIAVSWRRQGSISVLPSSRQLERSGSLLSVCSSYSVESSDSYHFQAEADSDEVEIFKDLGIVSVPLSLPSLSLPQSAASSSEEVFVALQWFSDEIFGGPPQLLAITSSGTIVLYELPPTWSALEPPMPSHDPFLPSARVSESSVSDDDSDSDNESIAGDYEVMITPHPDFGIGLRLEAQTDGVPAIAGSFKKHPLNGGRLPAEKTGLISLGDELVSVNGISLEGISFDDIIATVRKVGGEAPKGTPLCMKFRPMMLNRKRINSSTFSLSGSQRSEGSNRRTMEEMLGVKLKPEGDGSLSSSKFAPEIDPEDPSSRVNATIGAGAERPGEFNSRIIALIERALPSAERSGVMNYQSRLALMPWNYGGGSTLPNGLRSTALLVVADNHSLYAKRLEFATDDNPDGAQCSDLGSIDFRDVAGGDDTIAGGRLTIRLIEAVPSGTENWCIAVYHDDGTVRLVFIEVEKKDLQKDTGSASLLPGNLQARFRQYPVFRVEDATPLSESMVRASSVELFASANGRRGVVTVWCARPSPRDNAEDQKSEEKTNEACEFHYIKSTLCLDAVLQGRNEAEDQLVDIRFVSSGALDAFPWIVAMTSKVAVVYRRDGRSYEWKPIIVLNYPSLPNSATSCERFELRDQRHFKGCISPADTFPHLIPTVRSLVSVCDERHFLRTDWRPDAILAYACSDQKGIKTSLRRNVKGVYLWLSQWLNSDENKKPTMDAQLSLAVVPLRAVEGHHLLEQSDETGDDEEARESAANVMTPLSAAIASTPKSEEEALLEELQKVLGPSRGAPTSEDNVTGQSKSHNEVRPNLPEPLEKLSGDEIRLLWAMGEMLSDPPKFNNLDPAGQLTLFASSLLRHIDRTPEEKVEFAKESNVRSAQRMQPTFLGMKHSSGKLSEKKLFVPIASAGCLSGLTSSTQGSLVEACRVSNEKFNWKAARTLRLPFWIRSDIKLRSICEEVGQTVYKQTRDVMECALFFIIVRNMRTLRNLAATDQTLSGRTFFKFISDQDFSSPRGRKAAEKNAYSLLRKHRYRVAASFFLLAEPPMLKTALEIIVTQMEDLDLAFLVARMMENSPPPGTQVGGLGGAMGGYSMGMGFGGTFGAGGGYASGGGAGDQSVGADEVSFQDWTPNLGKGGKALINDRGLSLAAHDPCLKAILLVWLGRREEASRCLSGLSHDSTDGCTTLQSDSVFPRLFDSGLVGDDQSSKGSGVPRRATKTTSQTDSFTVSANDRVLMKANSVIDFVSCPFLVKLLNGSVRSRWASTLLVSRALTRRGFELASMRIVLQNTDVLDLAEKKYGDDTATKPSTTTNAATSDVAGRKNETSSSIFDSYESPTTRKPAAEPSAGPPSSIFDSFDAPPQKPKQPQNITQDPASSSIFAEFDAPTTTKPLPQVVQPQQMTSSIFDSFDAPPQKSKPAATSAATVPSIFDAFDAAPPRKTTGESKIVTSQSNEMASSIFDTFETPTNSKKPAVVASGDKPQQPTTSTDRNIVPAKDDVEDDIPDMAPIPLPQLWMEWRRNMLTDAVARRLLRDMASIVSCFQGDTIDTPMKLFRRHMHPFVPSRVGEILLQSYEGEDVVYCIRRCLEDVCLPCKLNESIVVDQALRILSCSSHPNRIAYIVLLCTVMDRTDQAEDVIRVAAATQMQRCEAVACSNDPLVENRKTAHHMASQYLRRLSVQISWQLEVCLWLNRGGTLPLSSHVIKQATVAVRVGLVIASWGRNYECFETMMRCEPDSQMDFESGRQLWSSMKLIVGPEDRAKKTAGTGSGGWEFLVDCRREDATEMLRNRLPGTFIIRPHAEDTGVFTLSFKTNLIPTVDDVNESEEKASDAKSTEADANDISSKAPAAKPVKKDDVVQHAIVRLSDAGFRCGSFGPFATLMQLLEAVSASLPFDLLFDKPPTEGIIKDEGTQPSPNAVFIRKLALSSNAKNYPWSGEALDSAGQDSLSKTGSSGPRDEESESDHVDQKDEKAKAEFSRRRAFGMFLQLLVLSEIRKQLSAVAAAECDEPPPPTTEATGEITSRSADDFKKSGSVGNLSAETEYLDVEESYAIAARIVKPLLSWCRLLESGIVPDLAPAMKEVSQATAALPVHLAASETAIELAPQDVGGCIDGGDAVVRRMIQPESGVEFRTLRVGESPDSAMIVLFSKSEAVNWLISSGAEKNDEEALARLARMEKRRVIEPIEMKDLAVKAFTSNADQKETENQVLYRFVDPWEVEGLESREGETMSAALGREYYYAFNVTNVARSCEGIIRSMGNVHLLGLWTYSKGGIRLTKAIASVHAPWERDAGGDLQMIEGVVTEPSAYSNSIRKHLYRNALFRRLNLPQRFLALVQVELLDLKNLTSPGGSPSLTVFALLRLKRPGSSARLTNKARTLDSVATPATKVGKSSGPNAPASWGSVVRFRFPLPEDVSCDGVSSDGDREALFKVRPNVPRNVALSPFIATNKQIFPHYYREHPLFYKCQFTKRSL